MAQLFTQEMFELKPLVKSIAIKACTQGRHGVKQVLALITDDNDIVIYYCYGELPSVVKRIPWFSDSSKNIQAACFDPTATWLLVVCLDSSLYIIPALYIVDKKHKIDCKWSLTDITAFSTSSQSQNSMPTCCVWWQTLECNQNTLIGFDSGKILLVSLTDGRVLGGCSVSEPITKLHVCMDNLSETVSLLINSDSERQWRLILEHHANGYTWPSETPNTNSEESFATKFYTLKQIGVDKLFSLKQRLGSKKDSQNDLLASDSFSELVTSDSQLNDDSDSVVSSCQSISALHMHVSDSQPSIPSAISTKSDGNNSSKLNYANGNNLEPEPIPQLINTCFTPQACRNRIFFSALHRPTGLLTIHAADFDTAPVFVYRVLPRTHSLILSDNLIYTLNRDINVISVISCQLAESRLEGETEFNEDSLVAQFMIDNENIIDIFKFVDMSVDVAPHKNSCKNKIVTQKSKSDTSYLRPAIDTCIVVTTKTVYKLFIRYLPVQKFIDYVTDKNDLEKAEKLSYIFNLNLQQLLEYCGDLMVSRGSYHSGIILYKQAKVHLLKRVLKLAVTADCKTLLKFIHLCLSASRIDMSITTRIHIGNVAVMAYVEFLLRSSNSEHVKATNSKDFMNFLVHESHFDPILAVNMTCQAEHWNIVNLLSKSRGLQPETVVAFGKILQNDLYPNTSNLDFLYALSEPTLTQSLLVLPRSSQIIFQYIRENVDTFPLEILKRLSIQLDPSQPCAIPFLRAVYQNKSDLTSDTNMESFDYEAADGCTVVMKDLVETFLYVILSLTGRFSKISFDLSTLEILAPNINKKNYNTINRLPDLRLLSCGYEHAAVIRNNCVYTMGVATSGCLGTGPMLNHTSGPRLVNTLHDLKVTPLSVSCGRKHTLCATDCGVFAWGSNSYGQLGLGPHLKESPCPQLILSISHLKIVDISAGQYHCLALTHTGKVYSWGWGIHGQLGHGSSSNEYFPKLVKFDHSVRQVSAGHAHSIILTCDGKVYGFGSNMFAQLENNCNGDSKKSTIPTWIVILPDMYVPVEKIATSYFHNMAITADQKVYMWGASPEEVRCFQQKTNQKQNNKFIGNNASESWKSSIQMYQSQTRRPIRQISVGYRHCAILDQGRILWGKNKDEELSQPYLRDPYEGIMGHRFSHVSCGLDYTMAIDQNGQVLAWGTPSMIETVLGVSVDTIRKKQEERVIMFKGTRRSLKSPHMHPISNNSPIEISVLPSMTFTYNQTNFKALLQNKYVPYNVLLLDNCDPTKEFKKHSINRRMDFSYIYSIPRVNIGQKTVHFALQSFLDLYDVETILKKSTEYDNYQVASKISFLHGHFVDSLGFTIDGFKQYLFNSGIELSSLFACKDFYDIKENDQGIELTVKSIKTALNQKSSNCNSPAKVLSYSSSLDSLKQFEEEGGQESPCEVDVRQNITNYVLSVKNCDSHQINATKLNESYKDFLLEKSIRQQELQTKNKQAKEILDIASRIVEFYIKKIYISENHILMQNILLKCIEFWLSYNFPVIVLENILLKNLDKYFYPLSILLFCKNFDEDVILSKDEDVLEMSSSGFLKEFSTKFCLHLCSIVLENANKS